MITRDRGSISKWYKRYWRYNEKIYFIIKLVMWTLSENAFNRRAKRLENKSKVIRKNIMWLIVIWVILLVWQIDYNTEKYEYLANNGILIIK